MHHISSFILYIGILFIVIGYVKQSNKTKTIIEYRYIPKTFEEEQENPTKVGQIFKNMFTEANLFLPEYKIGTNISKGSELI